MLEEYLKRLENLIVPHNFNKSNFREKIKAEFEDPSELEERKKKNYSSSPEVPSNLQSEDERKLVEEYIQKMGVKDVTEEAKNAHSSDNKIKIYQKILENEGSLDNVMNTFSSAENPVRVLLSQSSKSTNKTYSLSPSRRLRMNQNAEEPSFKERVHMLNIKSMNFRHEVELLKNKIGELNRKIDDQQGEIGKMERQRESNNKYLIKLETLLSQQQNSERPVFNPSAKANPNTSKINSSKILNFNPSSNNSKCENLIVEFNKSNNLVIEDKSNNLCLNFTNRNDIKDFIFNMMCENQKLKVFQSQVFEISKKYDDINENMIEGMKQIQQFLNISHNKETENCDENSKKDIINNFEKLIENVEKTIEIKQSEYNFLIESKESEMRFLQEEILKLNEAVEVVKRDRLRDQKTLNDYETDLNYLTSRIEEINGKNSESVANAKDDSHMLKLQKKIAPAKQSVNKIVRKFERTFDLQDKNNVKMLSNITKNIK